MGAMNHQGHSAPIPEWSSLPCCPRDFYLPQNGRHPGLTSRPAGRDTVMAVAADSHRNSPVTSQCRHAACSALPSGSNLRLFFLLVRIIISSEGKNKRIFGNITAPCPNVRTGSLDVFCFHFDFFSF